MNELKDLEQQYGRAVIQAKTWAKQAEQLERAIFERMNKNGIQAPAEEETEVESETN